MSGAVKTETPNKEPTKPRLKAEDLMGVNGKKMLVHSSYQEALSYVRESMEVLHAAETTKIRSGIDRQRAELRGRSIGFRY